MLTGDPRADGALLALARLLLDIAARSEGIEGPCGDPPDPRPGPAGVDHAKG